MPELPEVETIRRQLKKVLPYSIARVNYSSVVGSILQEREFKLEGETIVDLERKGKLLDFILESDRHVLSHLGMSGQWRISDAPLEVKHKHLEMMGESRGKPLYVSYVDPRRFGKMYFYEKERAQLKLQGLGVDIGSAEFTSDYIFKVLKRYPDRLFKVTLLDQKLFAGSGNYIANEICARAGILPTRRTGDISLKECERIRKATEDVLFGSLETQGTTFSGGYADTQGNKGEGIKNLVVFYQKVCQLCRVTPVTKIMLNGRGTYFCSLCQH